MGVFDDLRRAHRHEVGVLRGCFLRYVLVLKLYLLALACLRPPCIGGMVKLLGAAVDFLGLLEVVEEVGPPAVSSPMALYLAHRPGLKVVLLRCTILHRTLTLPAYIGHYDPTELI